jgi:phage-related protein
MMRARIMAPVPAWPAIGTEQVAFDATLRALRPHIAHIDAFIASYNETARPFVWTKSQVHQKRLKPCFADQ